jgi:hypothetical protein
VDWADGWGRGEAEALMRPERKLRRVDDDSVDGVGEVE